MSTPAEWGLKVGHLLSNLRVASDAPTFGKMAYGLFYLWGVSGLKPIPKTPTSLREISRIPNGTGLAFGKRVFGAVMNKTKNPEMAEEVLSEFITYKLLDKQHKLADKFKGMPLDEAEKVVMTAVLRYLIDVKRSQGRRNRNEDVGLDSGPADENGVTKSLLDNAEHGVDLRNMIDPSDLRRIIQDVQHQIAKKRPDIAKDIPAYFQLVLDGETDAAIINNKMLPFLQESPMSPQGWNVQYKPLIKKVIEDNLGGSFHSASTDLVLRVASTGRGVAE